MQGRTKLYGSVQTLSELLASPQHPAVAEQGCPGAGTQCALTAEHQKQMAILEEQLAASKVELAAEKELAVQTAELTQQNVLKESESRQQHAQLAAAAAASRSTDTQFAAAAAKDLLAKSAQLSEMALREGSYLQEISSLKQHVVRLQSELGGKATTKRRISSTAEMAESEGIQDTLMQEHHQGAHKAQLEEGQCEGGGGWTSGRRGCLVFRNI